MRIFVHSLMTHLASPGVSVPEDPAFKEEQHTSETKEEHKEEGKEEDKSQPQSENKPIGLARPLHTPSRTSQFITTLITPGTPLFKKKEMILK